MVVGYKTVYGLRTSEEFYERVKDDAQETERELRSFLELGDDENISIYPTIKGDVLVAVKETERYN